MIISAFIFALVSFLFLQGLKESNSFVVTSEIQAEDETEITCSPCSGGVRVNTISNDIAPNQQYAINCCFITAAGVNSSSSSPVYWADTYYNDSRSHYFNQPNGSVYSSDFDGWWGRQTFSPMTPIVNDFCLILGSMEASSQALIVKENGHVWAITYLTLKNRPNPNDASECSYQYVDARDSGWGQGGSRTMICDAFTLGLASASLYLSNSN